MRSANSNQVTLHYSDPEESHGVKPNRQKREAEVS